MAGGSEGQRRRGTGDRQVRRGGSGRRSGDGSSSSQEPGRQTAVTGRGGRHYSAYAAGAGHPRPSININQPPITSSALHVEYEVEQSDPVEEDIVEEEEIGQDEEVDEEDYSSIIHRASEYQRQPGREGLTWLNPLRPAHTLWFMDNAVSGTVTRCIQSYFKAPITSWSKGDMKHYSQWFLSFAQKYNWEPTITFTVWDLFKLKAISRLKDNTCSLKRNYGLVGDKARPSWITPTVWKGIKEYWGRTTSISRATKNSLARAQNLSKHTSGQISFSKRQIMEAGEDGTVPPLYQIYRKVHQRKDGSYITPEAEQVVHQTQQLIEERSTQMSPGGSSVASTNVPPVTEQDDIFRQVAPKNKKGQVVGLGSIQNSAFNCPSSSSHHQGAVSHAEWEQNQATIKALQEEVQLSRTNFQQFQEQQAAIAREMQEQMREQQANYARQMEEMRLMIQNTQVNLQHQSQGYRPMPPPMYDHHHGNAGTSTSPHDHNLDLSEHNIDLTLDQGFDFADIHRPDE